MDAYLDPEYWSAVSYDLYCVLWNFFISWEFGLSVAFLAWLRWYRFEPEVIEVSQLSQQMVVTSH